LPATKTIVRRAHRAFQLAEEAIMPWTWNWWIFLAAIIPGYILVGFSRFALTKSNLLPGGSLADYKDAFQNKRVVMVAGRLLAGVLYAAIFAAIVGLFF
jgi:hypothetical protein